MDLSIDLPKTELNSKRLPYVPPAAPDRSNTLGVKSEMDMVPTYTSTTTTVWQQTQILIKFCLIKLDGLVAADLGEKEKRGREHLNIFVFIFQPENHICHTLFRECLIIFFSFTGKKYCKLAKRCS